MQNVLARCWQVGRYDLSHHLPPSPSPPPPPPPPHSLLPSSLPHPLSLQPPPPSLSLSPYFISLLTYVSSFLSLYFLSPFSHLHSHTSYVVRPIKLITDNSSVQKLVTELHIPRGLTGHSCQYGTNMYMYSEGGRGNYHIHTNPQLFIFLGKSLNHASTINTNSNDYKLYGPEIQYVPIRVELYYDKMFMYGLLTIRGLYIVKKYVTNWLDFLPTRSSLARLKFMLHCLEMRFRQHSTTPHASVGIAALLCDIFTHFGQLVLECKATEFLAV